MFRTSGALAPLLIAVLACASPSKQSAPPAAAKQSPAPTAAKQSAAAPAAKASRAAGSSDAERDSMVICEMERPTGSNIAERVCRKATDAEMQRLRTQDMMRTLPSAQGRKGQ